MASARVLAADDVGFLKAVEFSSGEEPRVVSRWGDPGSGRGVTCCTDTWTSHGAKYLALARQSGMLEILDADDGTALGSFPVRGSGGGSCQLADRALAACVHLSWIRGASTPQLASVCKDGLVSIHQLEGLRDPKEAEEGAEEVGVPPKAPRRSLSQSSGASLNHQGSQSLSKATANQSPPESTGGSFSPSVSPSPLHSSPSPEPLASFSVLESSKEQGEGMAGGAHGRKADPDRLYVECAEVQPAGTSLAVGGKGLELCLWDLETHKCTWRAKNPKPNSLGLVEDKWCTALCHVTPSLVAAGTGGGCIHLFDPTAQRRPVASWDAAQGPIKGLLPAVPACSSSGGPGAVVFFGTGNGTLGEADVRKGQLRGKFKGGSGGSVRALAKHPTMPLLASAGLDRYLRLYDTDTRALKAQVFLKQHCTALTFCEWAGPTAPSDAAEAEAQTQAPAEASAATAAAATVKSPGQAADATGHMHPSTGMAKTHRKKRAR